MRTCTLAFSVLVHALVVTGFLVAPIIATRELPAPRRPVEFIEVVAPAPPSVPPPPPSGSAAPGRTANPHAAPVAAPDRITPEIERDLFERVGVRDGIVGGSDFGVPSGLVAEPLPPPSTAPPAAPLRVGGSIRPPQKIHHVPPVYPAVAQAAHKEGIVILEAEIGEDGRVRNTRVLRSIPLLDEAAVDAVRQWRFTATLLNGQPVPVVMTVTVAFTLR